MRIFLGTVQHLSKVVSVKYFNENGNIPIISCILSFKIESDKIKLFALKEILIYGCKKSSIKLVSTFNVVYFVPFCKNWEANFCISGVIDILGAKFLYNLSNCDSTDSEEHFKNLSRKF